MTDWIELSVSICSQKVNVRSPLNSENIENLSDTIYDLYFRLIKILNERYSINTGQFTLGPK